MRGPLNYLRRVAGGLFREGQPVPSRLPVLPFADIDEATRHTDAALARRKAERPLRSAASARGHSTRRASRHDPLMEA